MSDPAQYDGQLRIDALRGVFRRTRNGTRPPTLQLGDLLEELDDWLADDLQWRRGRAQHWKSLIDDVCDRLRLAASLSAGALQDSLVGYADALRTLRAGFASTGAEPDDALRRRLSRLASAARADAVKPELLVSGLTRISSWACDDPQHGDTAIGALRALADLRGHDGAALLARIDRILADNAWEIASVRGAETPGDLHARAGESPAARLKLAETVLTESPPRTGGVVWLEYLQAQLQWPWLLSLGKGVTLYAHDFLRPTVHQAPIDERIPPELRQGSPAREFLLIWLHAYDAEQAVRADYTIDGDPRVFLRMDLDEMSPAQLLAMARESAEFIVAFDALGSDTQDIWVLGESYFMVEGASSRAWTPVNQDKARDQLAFDNTAVKLARHADALGRHLPLRSPKLVTAGRLLVWLRQATRNDNPARLVLCDRVIEQVCGWAGISQPARL